MGSPVTDATSPRTDGYGRVEQGIPARALGVLSRHETKLWMLVIAVTVADGVLTQAGLVHGHPEGNPFVRSAVSQFGYIGIWAIKVGALAIAFGVRSTLSNRRGPVVPLALMVPWTSATVLNVMTLAA